MKKTYYSTLSEKERKAKHRKNILNMRKWHAIPENRLRSYMGSFANRYKGVLPKEKLMEEYKNKGNGICRLCKKKKKLVFDHCHKTKKFRGWICGHCNYMLGYAFDSILTLKAAIKYLQK